MNNTASAILNADISRPDGVSISILVFSDMANPQMGTDMPLTALLHDSLQHRKSQRPSLCSLIAHYLSDKRCAV